jgi:hypothetical protein
VRTRLALDGAAELFEPTPSVFRLPDVKNPVSVFAAGSSNRSERQRFGVPHPKAIDDRLGPDRGLPRSPYEVERPLERETSIALRHHRDDTRDLQRCDPATRDAGRGKCPRKLSTERNTASLWIDRG